MIGILAVWIVSRLQGHLFESCFFESGHNRGTSQGQERLLLLSTSTSQTVHVVMSVLCIRISIFSSPLHATFFAMWLRQLVTSTASNQKSPSLKKKKKTNRRRKFVTVCVRGCCVYVCVCVCVWDREMDLTEVLFPPKLFVLFVFSFILFLYTPPVQWACNFLCPISIVTPPWRWICQFVERNWKNVSCNNRHVLPDACL